MQCYRKMGEDVSHNWCMCVFVCMELYVVCASLHIYCRYVLLMFTDCAFLQVYMCAHVHVYMTRVCIYTFKSVCVCVCMCARVG